MMSRPKGYRLILKRSGPWQIGQPLSVSRKVEVFGVYRKFIRGFAEVASPLHALTEKSSEFEWTDACQQAFEELKQRLQTAPVLAYPLPNSDFILDTDASGDGIRAVLSQIHDGEEKVLAYASRKLSRAERN